MGPGTGPADLDVESALCNIARALKNRQFPMRERKPDYQDCTNMEASIHILVHGKTETLKTRD